MSYEIHLDIHEDSQCGLLIASLTSDSHLTPRQVIERIIDEAVLSHNPFSGDRRISEPLTAKESEAVEKARQDRSRRTCDRRARRKALIQARPETPDILIGSLADAPNVAENIRRLAGERRSEAFGNY